MILFKMLIFFAMVLGLGINYFTGGLPFSALLCIFAGIFLVMPGLMNFDIKDFKLLKREKKLTIINSVVNIIIIPVVFILVGILFFPQTKEVIFALAMLGILPGGGLLMGWIRQSQGNAKYGFALFVINMTAFIILFFVLNYLIMHNFVDHTIASEPCTLETATQGVASCASGKPYSKPILAYLFLVLIPFGLSRVLRKFTGVKTKIQKYITPVSKTATFLIILYIFSLKNIHQVFTQDLTVLGRIFVVVLLGYVGVFSLAYLIYTSQGKKTDFTKSLFWNTTIRFVTLGVVFGVMYVPYLGVSYIAIFASAYLVQTLFSTLVLKRVKK